MKVLAVDSATSTCSVALTEDGVLKVESTVNHTQTHARHLLGMIHEVMGKGGVSVDALDGFAVTIGPGSFTGLRIGISTVKGLALAAAKPVAPVSSLEALAAQFIGSSQLICPWIDARKQEVYSAIYRWNGGALETVAGPRVAPPDVVLHDIGEPPVFVGNGALLYKRLIVGRLGLKATFCPVPMNTIRASLVATLGCRILATDAAPDARSLSPVYIRRSDAKKPGQKEAANPRVHIDSFE